MLAGYRVEEIIGVGGMGVVYRATQLSLARQVALKVLSTTLVGNHRFRERFRLEGRHAAALDHPNIIPVYEAGESNGLMFIAMRLVDGPSLADLMTRQTLTGRESLRVLAAIASALDAAHESGLVHRDVKPQNILLTTGGHPYLADFGITKGATHGLTHSGDFVGSVSYVAPEQIAGGRVDAAADTYALTAVLFHCLTGALPYEHETEAAVMHAHLHAPPPTISARGIDASAALDAVFERGMAKDPAARFPSAGALLDGARVALDAGALDRAPALGAATVDGPPPAPTPPRAAPRTPPPPGPPSGETRTDRRRPGTAPDAHPAPTRRAVRLRRALLAGTAALLVGAPIAGYRLGRPEPPPQPAQLRSQNLAITHDALWTPAPTRIDGLDVDDAIGLRDRRGTVLLAGRLRAPAAGLDPLPAALRRRLSGTLAPQAVRLGGRTGQRYAARLRAGGALWLIAFPDSRGWAAVGCSAPAGRPDRRCASVAATLRVTAASPVALGPDRRVATTLDRTIAGLSRARVAARPRLRARSRTTRDRAAQALASSHRRAARTLRGLASRPQERPLLARLAATLDSEARVLGRLGRAARRNRRADYNAAREGVRLAERRVAAALAALRGAGYRSRRP